jgi:hypothetical protein
MNENREPNMAPQVTASVCAVLTGFRKFEIYNFLTKVVVSLAALELYVPGGYAAWNRGADFVQLLAPALAQEQGAGPDTVNPTIKLPLLVRPPVTVSIAIMP